MNLSFELGIHFAFWDMLKAASKMEVCQECPGGKKKEIEIIIESIEIPI